MSFQLQAFSLTALAEITQQVGKVGAFADVTFNEYNRIGHDGDGRLVISLAGADAVKRKEQLIVLAAFEGQTFQAMRRSFYIQNWTKGQEGQAPDCKSVDGVVPDADSPHPQAANCKACPFSNKDSEKKCSYRKDFIVYLVNIGADGAAAIDTSTAFTWQASSLSLFPAMDTETNSAGILTMVQLLSKAGATIEGVVFNLGFHQGSKAPVLTVAGMLPTPQIMQVIESAQQPEVRALLTARAEKVAKAATLPAPTRAPIAIAQDTNRAQAMAAVTTARAPRPAPPSETVPVQAPAPAPVQAPAPAPAATEEEDELDRMEREHAERLAAARAARAAAANKPAPERTVESTATVRTLPAAVAPPAAQVAPAPAPVAQAAPAGNRHAAFAAFGAARKQ